MGLSFKENCNDIRNTQVIKIFNYLQEKLKEVHIYDPNEDFAHCKKILECNLIEYPKDKYYDAIIIAVAHDIFKNRS